MGIEKNQQFEVRALLTFCRLKIVVFKLLSAIISAKDQAQGPCEPNRGRKLWPFIGAICPFWAPLLLSDSRIEMLQYIKQEKRRQFN